MQACTGSFAKWWRGSKIECLPSSLDSRVTSLPGRSEISISRTDQERCHWSHEFTSWRPRRAFVMLSASYDRCPAAEKDPQALFDRCSVRGPQKSCAWTSCRKRVRAVRWVRIENAVTALACPWTSTQYLRNAMKRTGPCQSRAPVLLSTSACAPSLVTWSRGIRDATLSANRQTVDCLHEPVQSMSAQLT